MDNEHPSNNLNQANSLALIDVIEEMTVDNDILENFLQEEYDGEAYVDEVYDEEAYVDEVYDEEAYVDEVYDEEAYVDEVYDEEAYVDEVYIEDNNLIIDEEFNSSQEIESQDLEYYTSHEMESPTNNQPNNCDSIHVLDSDDENTSNEQLKPTSSFRESLNSFNYIQTPPNRIMFPGYNETIFNELKNFISNKTPNEFVDPSRNCGISKYNDLLRLFVPNLWLNDLIIQQYIQLLIQNCNNNNVLNFGTYFFSDVDNYGFKSAKERVLKQQKNKKNVFDFNILVVPTHLDGNHWALIVANINERKIYVYDSFSTSYESLNDNLRVFISFLNVNYLEKYVDLNNVKDLSWIIIKECSPLQENSYDCGIFVCTNARYHIFDVSINFNQKDIPLIRQRMTYELIHNTLLSTH